METHIETIRLAFAEDATPEVRANGAASCRAILDNLEPKVAEVPAPSRMDPSQIANLASTIRSVPLDQLLDLAITKLRTIVPGEASTRAPTGFSVPFIQVPVP